MVIEECYSRMVFTEHLGRNLWCIFDHAADYLCNKDHCYNVQADETSSKRLAEAKIRCHVCGLAFASESEKNKHLDLEHMKNEEPAGVK